MLDLTFWIDRLKAHVTLTGGRILGAADLHGVFRYDRSTQNRHPSIPIPAVCVLREDESAGPNERLQGPVRQRIRYRVSVVSMVRNVRDPRGEAADDDLQPLRGQILSALIGWTPPDAETPVEFAAGRRLAFDDQVLMWGDVFTTYGWR